MTGERASVAALFDDYELVELARLCPSPAIAERCDDLIAGMFSVLFPGFSLKKYQSDACQKMVESLLAIPKPKPFPPTCDGE